VQLIGAERRPERGFEVAVAWIGGAARVVSSYQDTDKEPALPGCRRSTRQEGLDLLHCGRVDTVLSELGEVVFDRFTEGFTVP